MKLTNRLNLPAPFVDACKQQRRYKENRYSVTELNKGACEIVLSRRHWNEVEQDVSEMVWAIFGTAVHSILEKSQETDSQIKENYIYGEFGKHTVTGIFDLYDDSTGTVSDYKTASVWKVIYDEWDDYRRQILCYCCLLRMMGFNAHRGEIVAMLKDHSKSKAMRESGYPPHPVYIKRFEFTAEDFAECFDWIRSKLKEIDAAMVVPDSDLIPCTPEERWAKPDKWAVMKKGHKKALKLYDSETEAEIHALEVGGYVEYRKGKDGKCGDYCPVHDWCPYWRDNAEQMDIRER